MDNPVNWMYLKIISGSMIELIQFYFTQWSAYHQAIRAAAVAIVFSAGLVWMTVLVAKAPDDRLKSAIGAFIVIAACGVLLSPSSNKTAMYSGGSAGAPVANGTYWSYAIIGNFYSMFKSAIDTVFNADLQSVISNGGGPRNDAMAIAYEAQSKVNAKLFEGSPLEELYLDYVTNCRMAVTEARMDNATIEKLYPAGLFGGTQIGLLDEELSALSSAHYNAGQTQQNVARAINEKITFGPVSETLLTRVGESIGALAGMGGFVSGATSGIKRSSDREKALEVLRSIPAEFNKFDGKSKSYTIPTKAYWDKQKKIETTDPEYMDPATDLGGKMIQDQSSEKQSNAFYPKNCEEAFLATEAGIQNFRKSNLHDPAYAGKLQVGAFGSINAAQQMQARAQEMVTQRLKAAGAKDGQSQLLNDVNSAGDTIYGAMNDLTAKLSEWMLRFKIPMMIATCSMLAAVLLITFPIFCVMAVFLGHRILWTYLKLLTLAFLVVFLNDLLLGMASTLLASDSLSAAQKVGFLPGAGSLSADLSASTSKAVIFSALTVIEIAVAKLLLWDDVAAISGFSPSNVGVDSAAAGLKVAGSLALAGAAIATGGLSALGAAGARTTAAGATKSAAVQQAFGSASKHLMSAGVHAYNAGSGSTQLRGGGSGGGAKMPSLTPPRAPKNPAGAAADAAKTASSPPNEPGGLIHNPFKGV